MNQIINPNLAGFMNAGADDATPVDTRQTVIDLITGETNADFFDMTDLNNIWTENLPPRTTHPAIAGDQFGSVEGVNGNFFRASGGFQELGVDAGPIYWCNFAGNRWQQRLEGVSPTPFTDHCFFFPYKRAGADPKFVFFNEASSFSEWGPTAEDGVTGSAVFSNMGSSPALYVNGSLITEERDAVHDAFPTDGWYGVEVQADFSSGWGHIAFQWHSASVNVFEGGLGSIIYGPKSLFDTGTNRADVEAFIAEYYGVTYS